MKTNLMRFMTLAAIDGSIEVMAEYLVNQLVTLDETDSNGNTALHIALRTGCIHNAKWLLAHGANIQQIDNEGSNSLHIAAQGGHIDVLVMLLEQYHLDLDFTNNNGSTALHIAAGEDHLLFVIMLINNEANVSIRDNNGFTPIQVAALSADIFIIKFLMDYERSIVTRYAVMHLMAQKFRLTIIADLVSSYGLDINHITSNGLSILHSAAQGGNLLLMQELQRYPQFEIHRLTADGSTVLHVAALGGHDELVRTLITDYGFNVNQVDRYNYTPLHAALQGGDGPTLLCLLQNGATLRPTNHDTSGLADYMANMELLDDSLNDASALEDYISKLFHQLDYESSVQALHATTRGGQLFLMEWLINHGVDINALDMDRNSALHIATQANNFNTISWLIEHGADITQARLDGSTALDIANANRNAEVASYLSNLKPRRKRACSEIDEGNESEEEIHQFSRIGETEFTHNSPSPNIVDNAPALLTFNVIAGEMIVENYWN